MLERGAVSSGEGQTYTQPGMPIYEYRCDNGHTFEVLQRMTDDPVAACETCSAPVQRVFHPVAVHFKGSGFYNTDYGKRKRGGGGSDGSAEGSGSSEKKTESAKSESKAGGESSKD
jgi:putative FmdB family regulatory protein